MIQIQIDFSKNQPVFSNTVVGHIGEHNSTIITIIPPVYMSSDDNIINYKIAFKPENGQKFFSDPFSKNSDIIMPLCFQLTSGNILFLQLEGYAENKDIISKSDVVYLHLGSSLDGDGLSVNADYKPNDTIIQLGWSPANKEILNKFGESADGRLLYKGEYVTERPTAEFEFEGSTDSFAAADAINGNDVLIADFYMEANIPVGVEIKSIEFMYDEDIGWVDIREMQTVDGAAYTLSMHRTFLSDRIYDPGITCFAIVTFIESANFIYEAAHAWQNGKFRITYYTDNIGGENNA